MTTCSGSSPHARDKVSSGEAAYSPVGTLRNPVDLSRWQCGNVEPERAHEQSPDYPFGLTTPCEAPLTSFQTNGLSTATSGVRATISVL